MDEINCRIKELIAALGIKKTVFAGQLNVSQAFVSQMCSGSSQPSDRTISDICREFNVNEEWLRTGEGEMFRPKSRNEELTEFFASVLDEGPGIKSQLLTVMARLSKEQWELLEDMAKKLLEETKKAGS